MIFFKNRGRLFRCGFRMRWSIRAGMSVEWFWEGPMVHGREFDLLDQLWAFEMAVRYEARRVAKAEPLAFKKFQKVRKTW